MKEYKVCLVLALLCPAGQCHSQKGPCSGSNWYSKYFRNLLVTHIATVVGLLGGLLMLIGFRPGEVHRSMMDDERNAVRVSRDKRVTPEGPNLAISGGVVTGNFSEPPCQNLTRPRSAPNARPKIKVSANESSFECTTFHSGSSVGRKVIAVQSCTRELGPSGVTPNMRNAGLLVGGEGQFSDEKCLPMFQVFHF
eukprot:693434-Pelagomonas_calceolata.AAC.3